MKQLPENMKAPRIRPKAKVRLDANESPFNTPFNRYPDEKDLGELKHNWENTNAYLPRASILRMEQKKRSIC